MVSYIQMDSTSFDIHFKMHSKIFLSISYRKNNEVVTMTQFLQNIFNWFVGFGAGVGRHFFRKYQFERVAFMAVWFKNYSKLANILKEWQYLAGMTKIQKEWQKSGKNDKNPEGMTVVRKAWQ